MGKKNKTLNEKFLLFKHKIKTSKENNVIKLAFKVDANNKFIKDEHPNNLFTYFKLKVDTGLFFYFHAPFELDIGRTRPEDSEDNEYIKKECINLGIVPPKILKKTINLIIIFNYTQNNCMQKKHQ